MTFDHLKMKFRLSLDLSLIHKQTQWPDTDQFILEFSKCFSSSFAKELKMRILLNFNIFWLEMQSIAIHFLKSKSGMQEPTAAIIQQVTGYTLDRSTKERLKPHMERLQTGFKPRTITVRHQCYPPQHHDVNTEIGRFQKTGIWHLTPPSNL